MKDGNYFSSVETLYDDESKNTYKTEGCSNLIDYYVRFHPNTDYFLGDYGWMNESKLYYNYAHIFDDRVTINTGLSMGNGGYDHKKTEYYYDEKCRLHQVIEHASLAYTENDNGYDLKNYTSVSWLRLGEYKDIEVPKEYDTEFNPKNNGLRL